MCALCSLAGRASGGFGCLDWIGQKPGAGPDSGSSHGEAAPASGDAGGTPAAAPGTSPDVVETTDAANGTGTAYSIGAGLSARGRIASLGDSDWYRVDLVAGHTYTFAVAGEGATSNSLDDPYLRLRNSAGVQLAYDDDSGPGGYSSLTYTAAVSGTYYLDVQAYNNASTGWYGVSAIEGSKASYDVEMGAGALLVPNASWSASPGTGAVVTWGFRQSAASYSTPGSNTQATFSQLSTAEMAAVQTIMQLWADISGVQFQQVNPGGYTDSATILFANYNDPNDGAGAFAYYPGSTAASNYAGDVFLNLSSISTTSLPYGSYSFFAIMHEVGHTLGLAHPGDYNAAPGQSITYANNAQFIQDSQQFSVMSYFDEAYTGAQDSGYADSPMLFDVYALQQLYGANTSTRVGDTVYGFNSNAGSVFNFATNSHPAFTIWDGGGTDTIDASGYNGAQTINLNAGSYSSIDGGTLNIAIAFGAVIEKAIGGGGGDTITGNAANNVLTGNGGNDTLNGGDGFDTAVYSGARASYSVSNALGGVQVSGPEGTDTLSSIEKLVFSDKTILQPRVNFNADFNTDLLWQSGSSGAAAVWTMNGVTPTSQTVISPSPGSAWHLKGAYDFTGDSKPDLLWQNDNGAVSIWTMNGVTPVTGVRLATNPGPSWHLKSAVDFTGDGKLDLLWQNDSGAVAIWTMDGVTPTAQTVISPSPGPSWHLEGAFDFTGDGQPDLLWQNDSGAVAVWTMNGVTPVTGTVISPNPGPTWHLKDAADFTGDGKLDLLWQSDSGAAAIWTMNGLTPVTGTALSPNPGSGWHLDGAFDFTSDGKPDLLWQNDNGAAAIWTMDGLTPVAITTVSPNPGADWHLV